MKRLFIISALFFALASPVGAYVRVQGFCENGGIANPQTTKKFMGSYPSCTVTVFQSGTTNLASIFSDNIGTPKSNPFTSDSTTGYYFFYAASALSPANRLDIQFSGGGIATYTLGGILPLDPLDVPAIMVYPGAGLPISTGSAWASSLTPVQSKILIGNSTPAWAVSAWTIADPGAANGVLVSDGTNWTRTTVPNAGLSNSSITIAGHSVSLGGTQALASTDLSDSSTIITGSRLDNVFSGSNGFLKRTGAATYSIDTTTYLTGNQNITLSGDVTGGPAATAITTTVAKVNGVSYGTSPSTNTVPVVTGLNTVTYEAVPNAALSNSSMTIAGHSVPLGGTQTLATADLSDGSDVVLKTVSATFGAHTYDFTGTTLTTLRVGAGLTASANGDIGYDTTNKNWHAWGNAADNLVLLKPTASAVSDSDCARFSVSGGVVTIVSAGGTCTTGAGGGTVNSGTAGQIGYYATSTNAITGNANLTISNGSVTFGVANSVAGSILLNGSGSGTVTVQTAAAAGTWSLTLPTTGGTNGYFLQTNGSGVTTWAVASGSGTVNSGTASHLSYYASTTNAVSDMGADFTFSTHTLSVGASGILDVSAGSALKVPGSAAYAPTTSESIGYDTTGNWYVGGINGTSYKIATWTGSAPTNGNGVKWLSGGYLGDAGAAYLTAAANQALSNLSGVSINTSLLPQVAVDLGSSANAFRNIYLYGGGTYSANSIELTGTSTGSDVATFPDNTGVVAELNLAQTWTAPQTFTPVARSSGSASYFTVTTPADTGQTATTESIGANFTAATRTWATGAITLQRERVFAAPTYAFAAGSTITTAVNADFADPVAGTNATITNNYSIRGVDVLFTGLIKAGSGPTTLTDSGGKVLSAALNTVALGQGGTGQTSFSAGLLRSSGSALSSAELSGDVTTSSSNATTIAANAVTSAKMAVVNTRRTCVIDNDTQSATVLVAANFSGGCIIPAAATIVEVDVIGGTGILTGSAAAPTVSGTSSIQLGKYTPNGGASTTGLLSGALATASGKACALTSTSGTCINGTTSSNSITISTTSLSAGDMLYVSAATADGVQTWYRTTIVFTIN